MTEPFAETIFSKIIRREVPASIVFQDDDVTAFKDIAPATPVHILVIPNKHIPTLNHATADDQRVLLRLNGGKRFPRSGAGLIQRRHRLRSAARNEHE